MWREGFLALSSSSARHACSHCYVTTAHVWLELCATLPSLSREQVLVQSMRHVELKVGEVRG
jgi:hypothetical protein